MKIVYGVVGEGMGHAMRSQVVIQHLIEEGHQVAIMTSSRAVAALEKKFAGVGSVKDVNPIHGLFMITEENRVRMGKTILLNALEGAAAIPRQVEAYFDLLGDMDPEVVVSDFESWTYLYGQSHRLPVFSIDNMHVISRCSIPDQLIEGERTRFEVTKTFIKSKLPFAHHYFITSFFYPEVRKERTTLVPPILRPEILAAEARRGEHLLVYQTAGEHGALVAALQQSGLECRVYGMRRGIEQESVEGNIRFRPYSESGFIDDLVSARGVVASAGFTLMGECIYLGKPMLAVPLEGQFEQVLNARYLRHLGYGMAAAEIETESLQAFVRAIPGCEERLATYSQDGNRVLFDALDGHLDRAAAGLYGGMRDGG